MFEIQQPGSKKVCEPTGGRRRSLKANERSAAQGWIVKDHESKGKACLLHVNQKNVPAHNAGMVRLLTLQHTTAVTLPDGITDGCQKSVTTTDERPERDFSCVNRLERLRALVTLQRKDLWICPAQRLSRHPSCC